MVTSYQGFGSMGLHTGTIARFQGGSPLGLWLGAIGMNCASSLACLGPALAPRLHSNDSTAGGRFSLKASPSKPRRFIMNTKQLDKWITMLRRIKDEMDDVTNDLNDIHFGSNLSRIADRLDDARKDLESFRVDVPTRN